MPTHKSALSKPQFALVYFAQKQELKNEVATIAVAAGIFQRSVRMVAYDAQLLESRGYVERHYGGIVKITDEGQKLIAKYKAGELIFSSSRKRKDRQRFSEDFQG